MGGEAPSSGSCSSGEEDGDADWRANIDSVAGADPFAVSAQKPAAKRIHFDGESTRDDDLHEHHREKKPEALRLKLHQIKAQKALDDLLSRRLEFVRTPVPHFVEDSRPTEGVICLFKNAPPGMTLEPIETYQRPHKRPRILPGEEIDEKSKKFRRRIRSVAVDADYVLAEARDACQKSLARYEAKDAAAKAAAKREEERVAELKRIRGEKWLPSITRERRRAST